MSNASWLDSVAGRTEQGALRNLHSGKGTDTSAVLSPVKNLVTTHVFHAW